ncbi:hypothetical protein HZ326_23029 [Fusarium oxysporum f. sp. albedinis]|nr:hypothetical protein HZ326_23029 [Fusarium oxysporum f. sp. albedinis]
MWYHQIRETCFHSVLFVSVEEQRLCVGRIGSVSEGGCRTSVNPSPSTPMAFGLCEKAILYGCIRLSHQRMFIVQLQLELQCSLRRRHFDKIRNRRP